MSTLQLNPNHIVDTFVTELSRLGLNASPLKNVTRSACPANRSTSRYSFRTETNRAAPPTGSRELSIRHSTEMKNLCCMWYTSLKWRIRRSGCEESILWMVKEMSRSRVIGDRRVQLQSHS